MSNVTNTILISHVEGIIKNANEFFVDPGMGFVSMEDPKLPPGWYGGSRYLECEIGIGAFNHLDLEGLVHHLDSLKYPCQLIILEQDEEWVRIFTFTGDDSETPSSSPEPEVE